MGGVSGIHSDLVYLFIVYKRLLFTLTVALTRKKSSLPHRAFINIRGVFLEHEGVPLLVF